MTSWMECGCGGDVVLYENPDTERFGKRWMLLTGNCRSCGRYHEDVPGWQRADYLKAKAKYEMMIEEDRKERQRIMEEQEQARLDALSPEELLKEVGPDNYPWFHVFIHMDSWGAVEEHLHAMTLEAAKHVADLRRGSGTIRVERNFKVLYEGRFEGVGQ
ncbi:MAG: hypothetical protein IKN41_04855 [Candidatus Methanomethylophilaceae archaeon]|nr:hypothetical protein [Candidatus Methanomethylophilaceae archaeon]